MNLLEETIAILAEHDKTSNDVLFVSDGQNHMSISEFIAIANHDYDNGYGSVEVNCNLKIVGSDFWLERHDYDGSEWWEYKTIPIKPNGKNKINLFEDIY